MFRYLFTALSALLLAVSSTAESPIEFVPDFVFKASDGSILIEDGDSFWVGNHRVRLLGIDTLESNQPCDGNNVNVDCTKLTMKYVEPLLNDPSLICHPQIGKYGKPRMSGGRYVSVCLVNGKELNQKMVRDGYAVAFKSMSGKRYEEAEKRARATRSGLHKYKFERPIEFRRRSSTKACPTPK